MAQLLPRPLPMQLRSVVKSLNRLGIPDRVATAVVCMRFRGSTVSPEVVKCSQSTATAPAVETVSSEVGADGFSAVVAAGTGKMRLDTWLAEQLPRVSRARVQSIIRQGLAVINGRPASKVSCMVKEGDHVQCQLLAPPSLKADPENIPLDILFEDEHLLVVNKPAHMVVHPAPGHPGGTLVNALLHHCGLPGMQYSSGSLSLGLYGANDVEESVESVLDDDDEVECGGGMVEVLDGPLPVIRPGIVHRLDKGTSGLLVVAKDDYSHAQLCQQFKDRTVSRTYVSITCGVPQVSAGRVDVAIGRDLRDRKRMAAIVTPAGGSGGRSAASRYRVLEVLGQGGSALVQWKLETGRTHQIRVHAQHLGYPLLGDDLYGGTAAAALSRLIPRLPSAHHGKARKLVSHLQRPCLHAMTIRFTHPWTKFEHSFSQAPPQDFEDVWLTLQQLGSHEP